MKKLFCFFRLHNWKYGRATDNQLMYDNEAIPIDEVRECACCGKKQYGERHCLGLNPPEYTTHWHTINK